MAVPNNHSLAAEHRRHDRLLVARFAVGDATGTQEHEARDLVKRCTECAALAADITTIATSVAKLPAPPRPRDFRLASTDAAKLRGSRFDRWLRTITGSGWTTVRPVAAVALSVGLVMSVVGALPILGAAAGAPEQTFLATNEPVFAGQATPAAVAPSDMRADSPGAQGTPGIAVVNPGSGGALESTAGGQIDNAYLQPTTAPEGQQPPAQPQPTTAKAGTGDDLGRQLPGSSNGLRDMILFAGILVTLFALAVLALLYAARRRYYDPLLR